MTINPEYSNDRPEPFCSVLYLIYEHGVSEVLQSIAAFTEFESERENVCNTCAEKYRGLAADLYELAERADTKGS